MIRGTGRIAGVGVRAEREATYQAALASGSTDAKITAACRLYLLITYFPKNAPLASRLLAESMKLEALVNYLEEASNRINKSETGQFASIFRRVLQSISNDGSEKTLKDRGLTALSFSAPAP